MLMFSFNVHQNENDTFQTLCGQRDKCIKFFFVAVDIV